MPRTAVVSAGHVSGAGGAPPPGDGDRENRFGAHADVVVDARRHYPLDRSGTRYISGPGRATG